MTTTMETSPAIAIDEQLSPAEQAAVATIQAEALQTLLYTAVSDVSFHTCLKQSSLTTLIEADRQAGASPNFTKIRRKLLAKRLEDLHAETAGEAAVSETVKPEAVAIEASVEAIDVLTDPPAVIEEALATEPAEAVGPEAAPKSTKQKRGKKVEVVKEATTGAVEQVDDRVVPANISAPLQGFKFSCDRSVFAKFLPAMKRLVGTSSSHAILMQVLIQADGKTQKVVVTAFNLTAALRISLEADVTMGGSFTLPCSLLGELFARLPEEAITFEHDLDECQVIIGSSVGKHRIKGLDADTFPELPEFKGGVVKMPMQPLLAAIDYCEFSASSDATKQVLCGLRIAMQGEALAVASTDGHRLSTHKQKVAEQAFPPTGFTLPTVVLSDLRLLVPKGSEVKITFDDDLTPAGELLSASFIRFEAEGNLLICRLLDGQYPDYERLIPKTMQRLATLHKAALAAAVERVSLFAERDVIILRFDSQAKQVKISAQGAEGLGDEALAVTMTSKDKKVKGAALNIDIAYNAVYLAQMLRALPGETFVLEMNTPTAPCLVRAGDFTHLIMPVSIRNA